MRALERNDEEPPGGPPNGRRRGAGASGTRRLFTKVWLRVVLFLLIAYALAVVDRVNVGFAALTMNDDLSFSPVVFGMGAGVFFWGYLLFEIPSVLLLRRIGAKRWVARILIAWGLITILLAYVKTPMQFYVLRFLLGAAEAGLYPGAIYLLTRWLPSAYRAQVTAWFILGGPLAIVIGAPLSGTLLGLNGFAGLRGWQWLFLLDGLLTVAWGLAALRRLDDDPDSATWLTQDEKQRLADAPGSTIPDSGEPRTTAWLRMLADGRVWRLIFIYFGIVAGLYGVAFWLPQIVKSFGLTNLQTGFALAIPYALAALAMVVAGIHSDRSSERIWHIATPLLVASAAFAMTRVFHEPGGVFVAFCVAAMGIVAGQALFWTLPAALFSHRDAPSGMALVNSLSNLAGFLAPLLLGWVKTRTGNVMNGFVMLAALPLISAILTLTMKRRP